MKKLSKEEAKKIEQVNKALASQGYGDSFEVAFVDNENFVACDGYGAYYYNVPTDDVFELGEIETGDELDYENEDNLKDGGYYFVPTYDKRYPHPGIPDLEPDAYPSETRADEAEELCGDFNAAEGWAWDLFQKEVSELKKEQKQKQEEE